MSSRIFRMRDIIVLQEGPITDFSPLAAMKSPAVSLLYVGIFIYSCLCIAIGFKIANARWRDKNIMKIPPQITFIFAGVCFTLLFVVFIVPFFILCLIYTVADNHALKSHRRRGETTTLPPRRNRLRYLNLWDLSSNLSSSSSSSNDSFSDNASVITASSREAPPPHYSQYQRDTWVDPLTEGPQPETPPPVYFPPDRISEDMLTDGSNQGSIVTYTLQESELLQLPR